MSVASCLNPSFTGEGGGMPPPPVLTDCTGFRINFIEVLRYKPLDILICGLCTRFELLPATFGPYMAKLNESVSNSRLMTIL